MKSGLVAVFVFEVEVGIEVEDSQDYSGELFDFEWVEVGLENG